MTYVAAALIIGIVFMLGWYYGSYRVRSLVEHNMAVIVLSVTRRVRADLEPQTLTISCADERYDRLFQEQVVRDVLDRIDAEATGHLQ